MEVFGVYLLGSVLFSLGFVAGAVLRAGVYENQDWQVLRWDTDVLGYRPLKVGSLLQRNDKVMMALSLDSHVFPAEGVQYTGDDA